MVERAASGTWVGGRSFRIAGLVALALAAAGTTAATYGKTPENRWLPVIFVVAWLAPAAKRLADHRHGRRAPVCMHPATWDAALAACLTGVAPWLLLGFLHAAHPAWAIWTPLDLPTWLKAVGVVLAGASVFRLNRVSPGHAAPRDSSNPFVPPLTIDSVILALAMLLTSGKPVIALITTIWIATLWGSGITLGGLSARRKTPREAFPVPALLAIERLSSDG